MPNKYTMLACLAAAALAGSCVGSSGGSGGGGGGFYVQPTDAVGDGTTLGDATSSSGAGADGSGSSSGGGNDGSSSGTSGDSSSSGGDVGQTSSSGNTSSSGSDGGVVDAGSGPVCGNGKCEAPENSQTCPNDCPASGPKCGDLSCDGLETPTLCPVDCMTEAKATLSCASSKCSSQLQACQAKPACISAVNAGLLCMSNCGGINTTCSTTCADSFVTDNVAAILANCVLSNDCVPPSTNTAKCGDGKCNGNENAATCPADCKTEPVCGNGKCEAGETKSSCAKDCGTTTVSGCGDEICGATESANSCPIDCQTSAKQAWDCLASKCSSEKAKCQKSQKCLDALNEATVCVQKCMAAGGTDQKCAEKPACQSPVIGNSDTLAMVLCGLNKCPAPKP